MFSRPPIPDTPRRQRKLAVIAACAFAVVGAGAAIDHAANLERLRQMPLAHRQKLLKNLERFDSLPESRRRAILALDRTLAEQSDVNQLRYHNVLRRYHIWLHSLDEKNRDQIQNLEPRERLKLVENQRKQARQIPDTTRVRSLPFQDLIQISALVTESLRVSAIETRLWFLLQPEQRKKVLAAPNARAQREQLQSIVEQDAALQQARDQLVERLGIDMRDVREAASRRFERNKGKALPKNGPINQAISRVAEYKKFVQNQTPDVITARNLERFEDSMPPWVRESIDPLPPDAAQTRLKFLYRLVFPAPEELPEPKAQTKPGNAPRPEIDPNAKPF